MDTIEQIKGKNLAVLGYDEAQKSLLKSLVGKRPCRTFPISLKNLTMAGRHHGSTSYAYKPLELLKVWVMNGQLLLFQLSI